MKYTLTLLLPLLFALIAPAQEPKADWKDLLEKRTFKEGKSELLYRLMKPEGYDAKKKYPLVIFLHGAGERGKDKKAQLVHGVRDFASKANRMKYPCFLIAPQCPTGRFWGGEQNKLVLDLIPVLEKEFSIDAKRIYITGLSMGGFGTWDLIARKPEIFAAAVPICGRGDPSKAGKMLKVAVWAFHGDKDTAVKVSGSRDMIEAIRKAGGMPKYTEYPGVGHDSWTQTYRDPKMMEWLFAQRKE